MPKLGRTKRIVVAARIGEPHTTMLNELAHKWQTKNKTATVERLIVECHYMWVKQFKGIKITHNEKSHNPTE